MLISEKKNEHRILQLIKTALVHSIDKLKLTSLRE